MAPDISKRTPDKRRSLPNYEHSRTCGKSADELVMWQRTVSSGRLESLFAGVPSWLFLLSGLVLLGLLVLAPIWRSTDQLRQQFQLMQMQVEHLKQQEHHYQLYYESLVQGDPMVLEQLAFTQLHLKPMGKEILLPQLSAWHVMEPDQIDDFITVAGHIDDDQVQHDEVLNIPAEVDVWLYRPLPDHLKIASLPKPVETRLLRLSRGWRKLLLISVGGICIIGGLFWTKDSG